jgi:hydroxypyruvate isomerase
MPRICANLSLLFNEVPFLDRFGAAADAGFRGIEYLFPYEYPRAQLADLLRRHGLVQVLHNMPPGDWNAGERGIACHPDRVGEFQDGVGRTIEYATALECRQVNCLAGLMPAGVSRARLHDTLVSNLQFAAPRLAGAGIRLLIEPINSRRDMPGFFLDHSAQAIDVIRDTGSDNVFLQYDIYHMQIMEGDLAATIERHRDRIAHMQFADNPGRHEPGTGEIRFDWLFGFIDRLGYDGWLGAEYRPAGTTTAGLGWFAPFRGRPREDGDP